MDSISTIDDLFVALDGPAAVGRAIGVTTEHAAALKRRCRIPPRYWPDLLIALREKGYEMTEIDLTRIYNGSRPAAHAAKASAA